MEVAEIESASMLLPQRDLDLADGLLYRHCCYDAKADGGVNGEAGCRQSVSDLDAGYVIAISKRLDRMCFLWNWIRKLK